MSGMYWGLSAMYLLGKLDEMDGQAVIDWVLTCQHENGGFGGSARNDPHILYTVSAVQILALYDKLDLVDGERIARCECPELSLHGLCCLNLRAGMPMGMRHTVQCA